MPKISVILPAYNVEAYIARCLRSLQAQTFSDWEAVCVDDGSTDRTPQLLDGFAGQDARIRVIHQANSGVSAARNRALTEIRGEYCLLIDSDDFLHPQLMEICLRFAEQDGSDLVAFTYDRTYRRKLMRLHALHRPEPGSVQFKHYQIDKIRHKRTDDIFGWVSEHAILGMLRQKGKWTVKHCQPWRCLYRSRIVCDRRFLKGIIYEDVPWWGEVLLQVRTASILNLPLYFYYPNPGSLILSSGQEKRVESLRQVIQVSEAYYKAHANPRQQRIWEKEFLSSFRHKLRKKERRLARKKQA